MTERSYSLFEPDALLPAQFYSAFRGGSRVAGEKRLMLAVLEDAVDCYRKCAQSREGQKSALFQEVSTWILSRDRDWYFSYENICETLELSPDYLRRGLTRWKKLVEATPPPAAVGGTLGEGAAQVRAAQ